MDSIKVAVACVGTLAGCAQLLELPEDPELAVESLCADNPAPPGPNAHVRVSLCNWASPNCSHLVQGVVMQVCDRRDIECVAPLVPSVTDHNGVLEFDVPTLGAYGAGFDGYLRMSSTCDGQPDCVTIQPTSYVLNPPIYGAADLTLPVIPKTVLAPLLGMAGAGGDPNQGMLLILARDCLGNPVAGASYELSPAQGAPLYMTHGIVSPSATATDGSGLGGFLGVPPGVATVKSRGHKNDPLGETSLFVTPGTITVSSIVIRE
jgi:hypothetical protein